MAIKKRKREWVQELVAESSMGMKIVHITNREAVINTRGVDVRINLEKLPYKPTMNDVLTAITRSYSNKTRGKHEV